MRGVVLPVHIEIGLQEDQGQTTERNRDEEWPEKHGRTVRERVELRDMTRQLAPLIVIVAAGLAHVADRPGLAFYLLLATIPVVVAVALASYGDIVADEGGSAAHTALWTVGLVLVVATVALPSLGSVALTACLVLAGIQGAMALTAELRRRPSS
jgi:multisubunit Na+/H+ antiporter MnhB subunit